MDETDGFYTPQLDWKLLLVYSGLPIAMLIVCHWTLTGSAISYFAGDSDESILSVIVPILLVGLTDIAILFFAIALRRMLKISIGEEEIRFLSPLGHSKTLSLNQVEKIIPDPPGFKFVSTDISVGIYPTLYRDREKLFEMVNIWKSRVKA